VCFIQAPPRHFVQQRQLRRWLQLRFDYESIAVRLLFDCSSTTLRLLYVTAYLI